MLQNRRRISAQRNHRQVHTIIGRRSGFCCLSAGFSPSPIRPKSYRPSPAATLVGCALVYRRSRRFFDAARVKRFPIPAPDAEFIQWARDLVDQLREVAEKESWHVDWDLIKAHQEAGETAALDADFAEAGREYLRAVCHMMGQVRQQQARKESDRAAGIF